MTHVYDLFCRVMGISPYFDRIHGEYSRYGQYGKGYKQHDQCDAHIEARPEAAPFSFLIAAARLHLVGKLFGLRSVYRKPVFCLPLVVRDRIPCLILIIRFRFAGLPSGFFRLCFFRLRTLRHISFPDKRRNLMRKQSVLDRFIAHTCRLRLCLLFSISGRNRLRRNHLRRRVMCGLQSLLLFQEFGDLVHKKRVFDRIVCNSAGTLILPAGIIFNIQFEGLSFFFQSSTCKSPLPSCK